MRNNIRLQVIGHIEKLPARNQRQLAESIAMTAKNDGLTLVVALSYGSREEIVDAARALMRKAQAGEIDPAALDVGTFGKHLYTADIPDPDLLIRTSGECRVSNFLLWQISYAEIVITDVFWPDFRRPHLEAAIAEYHAGTAVLAVCEDRGTGVDRGAGTWLDVAMRLLPYVPALCLLGMAAIFLFLGFGAKRHAARLEAEGISVPV